MSGTILAAAGLIMTQMATPIQHQRAAMSVYQVFIAAVVEGNFSDHRTDADASATRLDFDLSLGTGVAVSGDGYVLTAHHVAGYTDIVENVCHVMAGEWRTMAIARMELHITLSDRAGTIWPALWDMVPGQGTADICSGPYGMHVRFGAVRFIASASPVADLALLKIDLPEGVSVSHVAFGDVASLTPFTSGVSVFGFTDVDRMTRQDGYFVRPCESFPSRLTVRVTGTEVREDRMLLRFVAHLQEGMSGGPVMSGDQLVAIVTNKALIGDIGLGIPVDYVRTWYEYVRNGREGPFPMTVCTP